ncbi:carboxypeptidase regulatory-like domain-containing protein [Longimicrobium sp.]|uniref:carboxypeptidase regulatory-like domain-containing protein n=1 Tax=Longimicrobium sp. TaxID=2029185 RepID=UPI002BFED2BD|nr:carboxypeptidase regulatory-like domain-containing protein [Longimicrobium sp.]HSU13916.1 carboxypeptidase regulatory-like domain-containing protein [Longimicrobium sp.]
MTLPLKTIRTVAVALAMAAAASRAAAQEAALVLTVTASETQAPLPGAQVKLDGRGVAVTDAGGTVRVAMAPGAHQVEVSAIGRHVQTLRATLAAGRTEDVEVQLMPDAVPLRPVTASESRGWEQDFLRRPAMPSLDPAPPSAGRWIYRPRT